MNLIKPTERIESFVKLGLRIANISEQELDQLYLEASGYNNWFTRDNIRNAFSGITLMLQKENLEKWAETYNCQPQSTKTIGVVMAGNIPMVGFHDYLCVLMSGHRLQAKLSSQDKVLPKYVHHLLCEINTAFEEMVVFTEAQLHNFDAIIATGSDNTARYFKHYFSAYPHIIRKNRSSIALLTGKETDIQYTGLGHDIFDYYGLGCRNISKVLVPQDYDFTPLLDNLTTFNYVSENHKYNNNYDYNKSIYLVNRIPHLDSGFLLVKEDENNVSPISVLFYERYHTKDDVMKYINEQATKIQCIVGDAHYWSDIDTVDFGHSQRPKIDEYADGTDSMLFLTNL